MRKLKFFTILIIFCGFFILLLSCLFARDVKKDPEPEYIWTGIKQLGGSNFDWGTSITVDSNGSLIATGGVDGNADLNGNGVSTDGGAEDAAGYGNTDIFISKFDSAGNWQWAKRLGSTSGEIGMGITFYQNNILVIGYFFGNTDLDGDGINETSSFGGTQDIFLIGFEQ